MSSNETGKCCTVCGTSRSLTDFNRNGIYKDGSPRYRSACRTCERARSRGYHHKHRDKRLKQNRQWSLRSRYGLSEEQYRALLVKQGGGCAICGSRRRLAVDHDHTCCPGKTTCGQCVRGVLCINCNNGLGQFNDDPELLARAIEYLRRRLTDVP